MINIQNDYANVVTNIKINDFIDFTKSSYMAPKCQTFPFSSVALSSKQKKSV